MKKMLTLLISLTLVINVNGQIFREKDNSLVWEITNKESTKTTYIVLTTSGLCEGNPTLITKVSHLLNKISIYYTETGIGNPKNEKESEKYALINDSDESVKTLLPSNVFINLKEQISGLNLPYNLDKLSPLMVNSILAKTITPKCSISNLTEGVFKKYAVKYNFEVRELINVQDAFKILNSYGKAYYASQIKYMLENKDKVALDITKKASLYTTEDLKGMQELYTQSRFLNARYDSDEIEKERAQMLISKIDEIAKTGGALITLDLACIMNGKYNLFSGLEKLGYHLQAVVD